LVFGLGQGFMIGASVIGCLVGGQTLSA